MLICFLFREDNEIIYILAKIDDRVDEKLEFKVDHRKMDICIEWKQLRFIPRRKKMKANISLYIATFWKCVISCIV